MASIPRPILNKIPGGGMPLAKPENHIKDLSKLTLAELLEIKDRENNLLCNKRKLNLLPDKGQRIQDFYNKVILELQRRSNIDEAANMFSQLNIAEKGRNTIDQLEWNGNLNSSDQDPGDDVLDSDDETEMDPLRLIAQRAMHERKIKTVHPEKTFITAEDLEDIKSFNADSLKSQATEMAECITADIVAINVSEKLEDLRPKLQQLQNAKRLTSSTNYQRDNTDGLQQNVIQPAFNCGVECLDQHARYIVDLVEAERPAKGEKFKPYQTTISHVHDPEKEKLRKKNKHWEVTAATPPPIQHSGAKLLTLLDSVELQSRYLEKLKELQEKQAAERLAAKIERLEYRKVQLPPAELLKSSTLFTSYRNPVANIEGEQIISEVIEVHDPLDEEKPTSTVNYTIFE